MYVSSQRKTLYQPELFESKSQQSFNLVLRTYRDGQALKDALPRNADVKNGGQNWWSRDRVQ